MEPAAASPVPNTNGTLIPTQGLAESNSDVVKNRKAIRLANMNAAEALKAELHGLTPLGRNPIPNIPAVIEPVEMDTTSAFTEETKPQASPEVDLPIKETSDHRGTKRKAEDVDLDGLSVPSEESQEEMPPPAKRTKTEEHDDIK